MACCWLLCLRRILPNCSTSEGVIPAIVPTLQKPWFVKQVSFAVSVVHRSHFLKRIWNIRKPTLGNKAILDILGTARTPCTLWRPMVKVVAKMNESCIKVGDRCRHTADERQECLPAATLDPTVRLPYTLHVPLYCSNPLALARDLPSMFSAVFELTERSVVHVESLLKQR